MHVETPVLFEKNESLPIQFFYSVTPDCLWIFQNDGSEKGAPAAGEIVTENIYQNRWLSPVLKPVFHPGLARRMQY
jgi:hypothetical protein